MTKQLTLHEIGLTQDRTCKPHKRVSYMCQAALLSRSLSLAAAFSAVGLVACSILWPLSYCLPPEPSSDSQASVNGVGFTAALGRLWLYSDGMPYTGSIISLKGTWDGVTATEERDWRWVCVCYGGQQLSYFGPTGTRVGFSREVYLPGFSYRHFGWASSASGWWTVAIHPACLALLMAVLPTRWGWQRWRTCLTSA